jgi:PAS domain S-box-containing protein
VDDMSVYRLSFDKMEVSSYLLDLDGQLIACNRQLLQFFGIDAQDKHSIYEMLQQHSQRSIQQEDTSALISGSKNITIQSTIHGTGDILYFEMVRTPLFDESGTAFGLMVTIQDITKQKKMELRLEEVEARLKYIDKCLGEVDPINETPIPYFLDSVQLLEH